MRILKSIVKIIKTPVVYFIASIIVFYCAYKSDSTGNGLLYRYIPGLFLLVISVCSFEYNILKMINPKKYILINEDYDYLFKKLSLIQETIKSIKVEKISYSIFIKSIKNESEYIEIMFEEVGLIILSDTDRHEHFDYVHTESKEAFFSRVFDELRIILGKQNIISIEEQEKWDKLLFT